MEGWQVSAEANELLVALLIAASWVAITLLLRRLCRSSDESAPPSIENRPSFIHPRPHGPVNGAARHPRRVPLDQM
jgi:hypothetical protein